MAETPAPTTTPEAAISSVLSGLNGEFKAPFAQRSAIAPFMTAARSEAEFDPDANLQTAASDGDMKRVKFLLESDATLTPNSKDENGYTAMHAAASYGHEALLEYLISKKGDVNVEDTDRDTPLHHCETAGCAAILIRHGADVTRKNNDGQTPFDKVMQTEKEEEQENRPLKKVLLDELVRLRRLEKQKQSAASTVTAASAGASAPVAASAPTSSAPSASVATPAPADSASGSASKA